ncbi:hypothetical protein FNV43_RR27291 [Rhamnella rubrinervis]|uniref:Uncharacterized protein n=1 Tax=Rhamnella rubrinervis TaxID=2594499 RepID=A0A8K0GPJ6_9ROSA|nr:hypothetical protein FNV43_RR27291 [Rhamnella rubrinervis]
MKGSTTIPRVTIRAGKYISPNISRSDPRLLTQLAMSLERRVRLGRGLGGIIPRCAICHPFERHPNHFSGNSSLAPCLFEPLFDHTSTMASSRLALHNGSL